MGLCGLQQKLLMLQKVGYESLVVMEYTESGAVQNQSTGCKSQHNTRVRQQQSGHKPALITAHTK